MRPPDADIAVLGAGPAGTICAGQAVRAGLSVLLIGAPPHRDGHAIESLPASGFGLARATGCLDLFHAASRGTAATIRLRWRRAPETRDFGGDGPLLVDRALVHSALLARAGQLSPRLRVVRARARRILELPDGVSVATDAGEIRCRLVIDARGRSGGGARPGNGDLIALPFQATAVAQRKPAMLLEALPAAWIWAAHLPDGPVHGAIFQPPQALAGCSAKDRTALGARALAASRDLPALRALRFGAPAPAGFSAVPDPVISPRHLLIGDAALARDPIASHGLLHALRGAVHGAAAAATILDPNGDTGAALAFLRLKHSQTRDAARNATARAYADQTLFDGPFWRHSPPQGAAARPRPLGRLRLARPPTRAPALQGNCIVWATAIELPLAGDFVVSIGPVTAVDVAAACRPAAPLADIASRLLRLHPAGAVGAVLDRLVQGGALSQADR